LGGVEEWLREGCLTAKTRPFEWHIKGERKREANASLVSHLPLGVEVFDLWGGLWLNAIDRFY